MAATATADALGADALDTSDVDHHTVQVGEEPMYWDAIPSAYYDADTFGSEPLVVPIGTVLEFKYSPYHNVWLLPSEEALVSCDLSSYVELAGNGYGGGDPSGLTNTYKAAVTQTGTLYVVCGETYHCIMGQKVKIEVVPPAPPPAPSRPPAACS